MIEIRMVVKSDIPYIKKVLDTINLFPSEMLDDMILDYFKNTKTKEIWFTALDQNEPISIGFCGPEKLTQGTYNLFAIGVKSEIQGSGIGSQMMSFIENHLREKGHRIIIVETSGTDEFRSVRKFYHKLHYKEEATIRDFWNEGDDKVVFWKRLN